MRIVALWTGKLAYFGLRAFGRRGSALPGLVVEKLYPAFLAKTLSKLPEGVVIITGTNGKTTSTKMLAHVLCSNRRVLTNPTGSNFIRGVISTIIHHMRFTGSLPYDIAIFELDEAYAARFVKIFKPRGLVVTNIMRDQMDRFGEIDTTAKLIRGVVENTTDFVVLNRDDSRVSSLARDVKQAVYYFGVAPSLRPLYLNDDELYGSKNLTASKLKATAELLEITSDNSIVVSLNGKRITAKMAANSSFNHQNAIAVCAAALALGMDEEVIINRLQEVRPAFGRGERIILDGNKSVTLQLVKNPGGFRHALHSASAKDVNTYMIAINDDYADGRDVSWLWDVDFRGKFGVQKKSSVYTSGTRAADMTLRLRYDDVKVATTVPSLEECLAIALDNTKSNGHLLIYTTYTAMLYLRRTIAKVAEVETI